MMSKKMTPEARAKVMGAVYYHKQGADSLKEDGKAYLHFGPIWINGLQQSIGVEAWTCGIEVCRALGDAGLVFEWNQDPDTCILVKND